MYAWPTRDSAFFHRFLAQNANLLSQRETLIFFRVYYERCYRVVDKQLNAIRVMFAWDEN